MVAWIRKHAPKPHVGEMDARECRRFLETIDELRRRVTEKRRNPQ